MAEHRTMKAIVRSEYGPAEVLSLQEIDIPPLGDDRVLVRVVSSSVNPMDWHVMTGEPWLARIGGGFRRPKNRGLGADFAGVVESVGKDVADFKPGDQVFGQGRAAYAEYTTASPKSIATKPPGVSYDQAGVATIAAITALQALRDTGRLQAGQHVIVNGASGGVGTYAVQIAKALGADVTAVCSTPNVDMVRTIGADRVIDYLSEDFTAGSDRFDVFLDNIGNHSVLKSRQVLKPTGRYVAVGGPKKPARLLSRMLLMLVVSLFGKRKMSPMLAKTTKDDLAVLAQMLETGQVRSIIDGVYPLADVPAALRYLGEGHTRGKSLIQVSTTAMEA